MLRKIGFTVFLVMVLAFSTAQSALADGPDDLSVNISGLPSQMEAGKNYNAVLVASSSGKGLAAKERIGFATSAGGKVANRQGQALPPDSALDDNGMFAFQVSFSQAGPAHLAVKIGEDATLTYSVKSGDNLDTIAATYREDISRLYERNKGVIGDDASKLSPGQILSVRKMAPSYTLPIEVTGSATGASLVKYGVTITAPMEAKAGSTVKANLTVVDAAGKAAPQVNIKVGTKTGTTDTNGKATLDLEIPQKAGEATLTFDVGGVKVVHELAVSGADPEKVEAKVQPDGAIALVITDKYGNPVTGKQSVELTVAGKKTTVDLNLGTTMTAATVKRDTVSGGGTAATPTASVLAPAKTTSHIVKAGDTLWSIWESLGKPGTWEQWKTTTMKAHNLEYTQNPAGQNIVVINPGQALTVPTSFTTT